MASKKELKKQLEDLQDKYDKMSEGSTHNYNLAVKGEKEVKETRQKLRDQEDVAADIVYIQDHKKFGETKNNLINDLLEEYRDKIYNLVKQGKKDLDL